MKEKQDTGKAIFMAALQGKAVDRPPLAQAAALTCQEIQARTGCFMPEAHLDPEKLVGLMGANHDILGCDAVCFIMNFFNEPAALGVEMDWGTRESLPVFRSHPWRTAQDAVFPPGLFDRAPLSTNLEALRLAKARYGGRAAVLGKIMGPLSFVQIMHGIQDTMTDVILQPELIAHYLDLSTGLLIDSGNRQFDVGIDALVVGEGGAGASMLSPDMYANMLAPYHKRLIQGLCGPAVMHMCGNMLPRLHQLADIGFACFNFDSAVPPATMVAAAAGAFTVMGNINTGDLLNGAPDEIRRQVRENIAAGVHIISPGCAVSPMCPIENLLAMREAIDSYSA